MTDSIALTAPVRLDELIDATRRAYDQPLDQLSGAVVLAEHLGDLADSLLGHFVDQARRAGASWAEIGRSMGVTKQAAQKRFVTRAPGGSGADAFARFTTQARNVIVAAHNAAHEAGNAEVGSVHLLLGLLASPGSPAVTALTGQGIPASAVTSAARTRLPAAAAQVPALVPFTETAKVVIQAAVAEADASDEAQVSDVHLLLALAGQEEEDGILRNLGLDAAAIRRPTASAAGTVSP
ncbi:MAG TPA: Clp protease N-terminal domain-containing protein [Streptosporangiaceae bacterium]|nr:Clp protease N-terminal domain-containing protein [Streptosporangiaceae bacterium]